MQIQSELSETASIESIETVLNVMEVAVEEICSLLTGAAMRFTTETMTSVTHLQLQSVSFSNQS